MHMELKRVYDESGGADGYRVLAERLWPRGVSKAALRLDEWRRKFRSDQRCRPAAAGLAVAIGLMIFCPTDAGCAAAAAEPTPAATNVYARWPQGPNREASFFPLAVWLQDPRNALRYQALGINLYVGLWQGPTAGQIAELTRHRMPVICEQNAYALQHLDERMIVGWMHGDEPDNAQPLPGGKGYGPPIPPETILRDYRRIQAHDSSRPVMLNLGQGVAWDDWYGRGVRTRHPEDYREYVRGGDIVSFDIYPAVHEQPAVAGKLWYVARGVERLRTWAGNDRIVWNCIECTRIGNTKTRPTPQQVRAEVWMALIHGSQGIIYFCHQFQPRFIEAGLLADEELARAVGAINKEIQGLAAVINSPALPQAATVIASPAEVAPDLGKLLSPRGIALAAKKHHGATYLFAVRMEASPAQGIFQMAGMTGEATIRVIGEDRTIRARDGRFVDDFAPYAVHLYQCDGVGTGLLSFVPEMGLLPGMDTPEYAHRWTDADKARWGEDIRRATARWKEQIPGIKEQLTAERVKSLSNWAKPQMEGYKSVPALNGVELRPVGTDAQRGKLVLEGTLETLPTHSPLVTRWLKVFLLYDVPTQSLTRITITIRGEVLE
ncbi:MAG: hypothetical protein NTV49_08430 [Kiritimatiellaeota bacterium]|nr:hypothetical protein [Kiritimatiellota bacterium]